MNKKIRSNVVKESLMDYNALANSIKENTEGAVKSLLDEAVRDTYAKLLSEDDDKEYDEEEVEDTNSDTVADDVDGDDTEVEVDTETEVEDDGMDADEDEVGGALDSVEDGEADDFSDADDEAEWAEFDKYKVSDDEYDFSNAEDDEIVKVYKLMKNDDQIFVHKDEDKVKIQDNETGAEYLIDLGDEDVDSGMITDDADDFGEEDELENNEFDDMNESTEKMFELVLEYDSNVGYTDNYQKKDVMTNPGMSEPGKNVNDWDAGVPKGDSKPWSGYPGKKNKADKPFNAGKGKQLEEDLEEDLDNNGIGSDGMDAPVEEGSIIGGRMGRNARTTGNKVHRVNNPAAKHPNTQHVVSRGGEYVGQDDDLSESLRKRVNKSLKENKALKSTLTNIMESLKGAAVTNHNLAQIIKLISENTTSQDEKKEIIARFAKEGKTIEASKNLYESINNELKKSHKMNITEGQVLSVDGSKKINETTIYKSPDLLESLDLMHRMK